MTISPVSHNTRPESQLLPQEAAAFDLLDKAQNTHRAIDDVLAMFEVMKAMEAERDDLASYIKP